MSTPPNDLERRRALAATIMADTVRAKPPAEQFAAPVAWMLGPEMLGALKQFALHALYKGEFDPHDWMMTAPIIYPPPVDGNDFWFDFIADIGDGQRAMYTTAAVLQDDLFVEGALAEAGAPAQRQRAAMLPAVTTQRPDGWSTLKRGQLVVVGGDTAYPLADFVNIDAHVRQPFTWAYRDLVAAGRLTDDDGTPHAQVDLYGVPGNHDYYDLLVGYGRLYRQPITDHTTGQRADRLPIELPGFRRCQTASYAALELPWNWRLWAIDPGERDVDYRQECFFREHGVVDKMIVVTPTPAVVFGRVLAERGFLGTMHELGLAVPFLGRTGEAALLRDGKPADPAWRTELAPQQCRVDLAGDMHCYQRYGSVSADGAPATADANAESNYAAVVSGAGGAFCHSTATDFGERTPLEQYPSADTARRTFGKKLFAPLTVFNNGVVNMSAFVLALVICAGSIRFDTRIVTDTILYGLGVRDTLPWSGGQVSIEAASWTHYLGATVFVGSIVVAAAMCLLALRYALWVTHSLRRPQAEWPTALRIMRRLPGGSILEARGFLPSWVLTLTALALPALVSQLVAMPGAAAVLFQILFITVVLAIVGGLLIVAMTGGAEYQRPRERWVFAAIGTLHAMMQILLPLVIVRVGLARPVSLLLPIASYVLLAAVARWLFERADAWARAAGLVVWIVHAVVVIASIVVVTDGVAVAPVGTLQTIMFLLLAGIVGAVVGCFEFGWYLAVAAACNGHNNEAGAAARIDNFRQFIRFRVQPDRITGYVIAIDELGHDLRTVQPRIVDVFTVAPRVMTPP